MLADERTTSWTFLLSPQDPKPTERRDAGTSTTGTADPAQQPKGQQQNPCGMETLMWMAPMLLVLWLVMVRPAQKQNKVRQEMLKAVKKGDKVVTNGGVHGEVTAITDHLAILKVDTIKMTIDRSAIARVLRDEPKPEADDKSADKAKKG